MRNIQSEREEGLVIPEVHIIFWPMFLDKVIFENKSFFFGLSKYRSDAVHALEKISYGRTIISSLDKITPDAIP